MKWRQVAIIALMFVLVFSLSGCDLLNQVVSQVASEATTVGEDSQPTPTVKAGAGTAQPTAKATAKPSGKATVVPTGESSEDEIDPNSLQTIDILKSYHLVQTGQFTDIQTDTTVSTSTIDMEVWETKSPPARRLIYKGSQTGNPESSFELITIGNDTYMKSSDSEEWLAMSSSTTETNMFGGFTWFTDPASAMQGDSQLIGTETINGMAAKHYRYTGIQVFGKVIGTNGKVDISQADIWVSDEFNVVIRYVSHWKGTDDDGIQSEYKFTMDVTEINTPIVIEAPKGVAKAGLPDDVPLMDEATDVNAFAGIVSFKVAASLSEVMDFYASALPDNGWTAGDDQGVPGMASYTKDTRTLTLIVSEDDDESNVTIMVQEQE
ncbi:MAG: hypothetical protein ACYCZF_13230 [Anaerolineae bacterium]